MIKKGSQLEQKKTLTHCPHIGTRDDTWARDSQHRADSVATYLENFYQSQENYDKLEELDRNTAHSEIKLVTPREVS